MGGDHSKENVLSEYNFDLSEYSFHESITNQLLGTVANLNHKKTNKSYHLKEIVIPHDKDYLHDFTVSLAKLMKLKHSHLLKIVGINRHVESNLCGETNVMLLAIEKHTKSLLNKIAHNKQKSLNFLEIDIWKFIFAGLSLLSYFQQNDHYLGNISLRNIVQTKKKTLKFVDHNLSQNTNLIEAQSHMSNNFLCPELYKQLNSHTISYSGIDKNKSDIFSFGMVLLHMCNLKTEIKNVYDDKKLLINSETIEKELKDAEINYSDLLVCVITDMLRVLPEERPDANDLLGFLSQYKDDCITGKINKENETPVHHDDPRPHQALNAKDDNSSNHDSSHHDSLHHDSPHHDSHNYVSPHYDSSHYISPHRDFSHYVPPSYDYSHHNRPHNDSPHYIPPHRDSLHYVPPHNDSPHRSVYDNHHHGAQKDISHNVYGSKVYTSHILSESPKKLSYQVKQPSPHHVTRNLHHHDQIKYEEDRSHLISENKIEMPHYEGKSHLPKIATQHYDSKGEFSYKTGSYTDSPTRYYKNYSQNNHPDFDIKGITNEIAEKVWKETVAHQHKPKY